MLDSATHNTMTNNRPLRVLILARVSHDSSGVGRSVNEQVDAGKEWVKREGWELKKVIRETGSASRYSTRRQRAEWNEALAWIESGEIDALLTWENSRATRDLSGYTELRQACAKNKVKWGYGGTLYDLTQRSDRFRTGLDALLAEDEADRTSERVKRAHSANARAGRPHGKAIFGYRRIYDSQTKALLRVELDPAEAALIREAAQRYLDGETLYSIAQDWNDRGIPARRPQRKHHRGGWAWRGETLKQMLEMPAYAGLRQYRGEIIGEAMWDPIIDPEAWHKLQALLHAPERKRADVWKIRYLLTGVARCGYDGCVGNVRVSRNSSKTAAGLTHYQNYICEYGPHCSMNMKFLDAIVTEHILERMSRPDFLESLHHVEDDQSDQRRALMRTIAEHRAWLDSVRERAAEERNLELLFDQERRIKPLIDEATKKLNRLSTVSPHVTTLAQAPDLREAWEGLAITSKREIVRSLLEVQIFPAPRRGAKGIGQAIERTTITWKHTL